MDSGTLKGSWKCQPWINTPQTAVEKKGGTIEVFEYHYLRTTTLFNKPWLSINFQSISWGLTGIIFSGGSSYQLMAQKNKPKLSDYECLYTSHSTIID
jgi:hypothetical protein